MVQFLFTTLTGLFHKKCNRLKARVVIYAYNHHVRLLSPEPAVVHKPQSTRVEEPTLLCNHAGPHTAVRRVELGVKSRAFDAARRQMTIRSLRRRPSELHSSWRPEGQQGWLFCRWSLLRSRDLLATPFRSGLPPVFWSSTPFADFCSKVRMNRFTLSHDS